MTTAYTSLLGLALPVTGELSGTWGDTVNTAITSLLDTAVAGTTSITVDADITLSTTTGASNEARQAIILWNPASGTVTRNITAPAQSKLYTVINASGGTQSIVIRGAGPTTGVTIAKGESAQVAWNGSDFVKVGSSGGAITFTNLTVTGNTILGDAAADTLTVNATSTFAAPVSFQALVNLPSTGRSAAAALTPTNPAFLYGVASTYTDTASSGTLAPVATFYSLARPTLATSNVTTYTNAATLYIANSPAAGGSATITNPYAVYVAAGAAFFGGGISGSTVINDGTANGVAYLNGSKVLTTGSALTFDGTNLETTGNVTLANNKNFAIRNTGGTAQVLLTLGNDNNVYMGQVTSPTAGALFAYAAQYIYTVGASELMRLTSTGLGIGTNSPTKRLDARGSASGELAVATFSNDSTAAGTNVSSIEFASSGIAKASIAAAVYDDGWMAFRTNDNSEKMRLTAGGNLGIGTSSPTTYSVAPNLVVASSGGGGMTVRTNSTYGGVYFADGVTGDEQYRGYVQYNHNLSGLTDAMVFGTAGTGKMTLDSSGSLLVGTTTSIDNNVKVQLATDGTNTQRFFGVNNNTGYGILLGFVNNTEGNVRTVGAYPLAFGTNNSERMRITAAGEVGIGTSSPIYDLQVGSYGTDADSTLALASTTTGTGSIRFGDGTSGTDANAGLLRYDHSDNSMVFWTVATERMRITSAGNVGIGTTDEYGRLNVQRFVGAPQSTLSIGDFSVPGNSVGIYGRVTSGGIFGISTAGSPIVFYRGGPGSTESARITADGALRVGTTGGSGSVIMTVSGNVQQIAAYNGNFGSTWVNVVNLDGLGTRGGRIRAYGFENSNTNVSYGDWMFVTTSAGPKIKIVDQVTQGSTLGTVELQVSGATLQIRNAASVALGGWSVSVELFD